MKQFKMQIKKLMRGEEPLISVWYFLQGNYRYYMYYNPILALFLRMHIIEQIEFRIANMDAECLENGECKLCGCQTTALQMCNKPCSKPCYPRMMNKWKWKEFKEKHGIYQDENGVWSLSNDNKLNFTKNVG